jgi:hypothetical protein
MSEQDLTEGFAGLPSQQEGMSESLIYSLAQGFLKKLREDENFHGAKALLLAVAEHELNESSLFRKLLAIYQKGLLGLWSWTYRLLEKLDAISDVAALLVLLEQLGQPSLSTSLLVRYLDRETHSPEGREELKVRLTEELNELRRRGKPVTLVTEEDWLLSVYGHVEDDGEESKEGSSDAA